MAHLAPSLFWLKAYARPCIKLAFVDEQHSTSTDGIRLRAFAYAGALVNRAGFAAVTRQPSTVNRTGFAPTWLVVTSLQDIRCALLFSSRGWLAVDATIGSGSGASGCSSTWSCKGYALAAATVSHDRRFVSSQRCDRAAAAKNRQKPPPKAASITTTAAKTADQGRRCHRPRPCPRPCILPAAAKSSSTADQFAHDRRFVSPQRCDRATAATTTTTAKTALGHGRCT